MPNRILKESILDSPTLARLDEFVQDQIPRLFLLMDDWGCLNCDPEAVKGRAYSKRKKVTPAVIEKILEALWNEGLLFRWIDGDRIYGFWVSWDQHNYCNGSAVDEDGKQAKHRRKTPEPPQDLLNQYIEVYKNRLEQLRTVTLIPIPIPIPIPKKLCEEEDARAMPERNTPETLFAIYNRERGSLLECRKLNAERRKHCLARLEGREEEFTRDFTSAVIKARASPFMTGMGPRKWIADFDFFVKNDTNYLKVLEGKYDRITEQQGPPDKQEHNSEAARRLLHRLHPEDCGCGQCAGRRGDNSGLLGAAQKAHS